MMVYKKKVYLKKGKTKKQGLGDANTGWTYN